MSDFKSLLNKLSPAQVALARRISDAGLASYTQAVKSLATGDQRVSEWKRALDAQANAARSASVTSAQDFRKPAPQSAPVATPELPALMGFINLTPHAVSVQGYAPLAPSGAVARCAETRTDAGSVAGVPVTVASFGTVEGLPEPRPSTYYIVSALVLAQVPDRADVFAPGPALRDAEGRVVGCVGLSGTPAFAAQRPTPPTDWPGGDWESGDAERRTDDPAGEDAPSAAAPNFAAVVGGKVYDMPSYTVGRGWGAVSAETAAQIVAHWRAVARPGDVVIADAARIMLKTIEYSAMSAKLAADDAAASAAQSAQRGARRAELRARGWSESRIDYEMRNQDEARAVRDIARED